MQIILTLKGHTLSYHRSSGNLSKSTGYINPCKSLETCHIKDSLNKKKISNYLNCRRKCSDKFVDLVGRVVVASDEDDLISLG